MRILLGMSGGLDSTYTAELLKKQGHEVDGVVLCMHDYTDISGAYQAAKEVGISLAEYDCRTDFDREVASYFANEYSRGRTPNPCTVCNRLVKFRALEELARKGGYDKMATGHYARRGIEDGRYFIKKGLDSRKDQSYMLWSLTQEQLSMLYLPLGEFAKENVRESARASGISSSEKAESQDICFLPDGNYAEFVESRMGKSVCGDFIDGDGNIIGKHKGIIHYTVGQRRGLGIALGHRMFVSKIDAEANTVTLLPDGGEAIKSAVLENLNFQKISPPDIGSELRASIKTRYASQPIPCRLIFGENSAEIEFESPVKSITPGQSGVVYQGDDLILGGLLSLKKSKPYSFY